MVVPLCENTACRATGNKYTNIGRCPDGFKGVACTGPAPAECTQKGRAAGCVPINPVKSLNYNCDNGSCKKAVNGKFESLEVRKRGVGG